MGRKKKAVKLPNPRFQLSIPHNATKFTATLPAKLLSNLEKVTQILYPSRETSYMYYSDNNKPCGEDQLIWYLFLLMLGMKNHFDMDEVKWDRNFNRFCEEYGYLAERYANDIKDLEGIQDSIPAKEHEPEEEVHGLKLTNGQKVDIPIENYNIICSTAVMNDIEISDLKDDDFYVMSDSREKTKDKATAAYIKEITQHLKTIKDRLNKSHNIRDEEDLANTCAEGLALICNGDKSACLSYIKTACESYEFINVRETGY